jgi:hypothetical protein
MKWSWVLGLVVVATIGFVVYIAYKATKVVQSYTVQTPQVQNYYPIAGSQPGVSGGSTTSTTPSQQPLIQPSPLIAIAAANTAAILTTQNPLTTLIFGPIFGW